MVKPRNALLFLFSHRFLALARWDLHFIALRLRAFLTNRNGRIAARLKIRHEPLYLNLGSGPRGVSEESWINIDGYPDRNVEFLVDLNRRLPFPDATFDGVFSEHVLEHFSLEEGMALAQEVHRLLKPGGIWRIVVPDAERIVGLYVNDPDALVAMRGIEGSAMEAVNSYFRQRYEHQFLYDWETMQTMLLQTGFAEARQAAYGAGDCPDLLLDDAKYAPESLYVEAFGKNA